MSDTSEVNERRKRNRPSLVCNFCKKRKTKCDKGRPCSMCVKSKAGHSCTYDSNWVDHDGKIRKLNSQAYVQSAKFPIAMLPVRQSGSGTAVKDNNKDSNVDADGSSMLLVSKRELEELREKLRKYEDKKTDLRTDDFNDEHKYITKTIVISEDNHLKKIALCQSVIEFPTGGFALHNPKQPGEIVYSCNDVYTDDLTSTDTQILASDGSMFGINPYDNNDEKIDLFGTDESDEVREVRELQGRFNRGALTWASVARKDPAISLLKEYIQTKKKPSGRSVSVSKDNRSESLLSPMDSATPSSANSSDIVNTQRVKLGTCNDINPENTDNFEQKDLVTNEYVPYKNTMKDTKLADQCEKLKQMDKNTITLGLTLFDGQVGRDLKLIEQIKYTLPKRKVIWLLIKRFFRFLYPFFPFLDEISFREDISTIIGAESFEDKRLNTVSAEKRIDLANLGILLILLRLSYLSLFSNSASANENNLRTTDISPKAKEIKYLLSNPISVNAIDVAQICLHQFQLTRKLNLPVLQCALFVRLYQTYARSRRKRYTNFKCCSSTNGLLYWIE